MEHGSVPLFQLNLHYTLLLPQHYGKGSPVELNLQQIMTQLCSSTWLLTAFSSLFWFSNRMDRAIESPGSHEASVTVLSSERASKLSATCSPHDGSQLT